MVNMGKADIYVDDKNNWEVYTDDGLPSAQWEIMVLVTEDGHEVLTGKPVSIIRVLLLADIIS